MHCLSSPIFTCCLNRSLRRPWTNLTSMFLNFEGAGSGGYVLQLAVVHPNFNRHSYFLVDLSSSDRPRTTTSSIAALHHIHVDVFSQDAWDRGVIRSDTDYSVYASPCTGDVSRFSNDDATFNATGYGCQGPGVARMVQTSPFIAHIRDTIPWMIRSVEWVMRAR